MQKEYDVAFVGHAEKGDLLLANAVWPHNPKNEPDGTVHAGRVVAPFDGHLFKITVRGLPPIFALVEPEPRQVCPSTPYADEFVRAYWRYLGAA